MLKFSSDNPPQMDFKRAVKRPIPIRCIQIDEPFEVETMEGPLRGKKGDWLMIGIRGEMYPCDREIFTETYELMEK